MLYPTIYLTWDNGKGRTSPGTRVALSVTGKAVPDLIYFTGSVVVPDDEKISDAGLWPDRQEPRLLQTYDIIADSDALARAMAWRRYDKLIRELADQGQPISALRAAALHFTLSEDDRILFESARKDDEG